MVTHMLFYIIIICTIFLLTYVFSLYYMKHKTQRRKRKKRYNEDKVIVFDMDETLGNFYQLGILIQCLENITGTHINQEMFNQILDLYPEFLRPDIIKMLKYTFACKTNGKCRKVFIFTNNRGPKSWSYKIKNYFESKTNKGLFDRVIGAYKVDDVIVEPKRTSNEKRYDDLETITNIKQTTAVMFLDDQEHPEMIRKNVHYILLPRYEFYLPYTEMLERIQISDVYNKLKITNSAMFNNRMIRMLTNYYVPYKNSHIDIQHNKTISRDVMKHIKDFFKPSKKNKTRRRK